MLKGILILIIMLVGMILMATKKMPTSIALLAIAILVCVVAGIPAMGVNADGKEIGWFTTVLVDGTTKMAKNYIIVIFCSWLGVMMEVTGVTRTMIKKGAELGGDKVIVVHIILYLISILLLSVVSGLGGVIMIGSLVIPILVATGVDTMTAAVSFLFAKGIGATFQLSNVNTFVTLTGMDFDTMYQFALILSAVVGVAGLVYIVINDKKNGKKFAFAAPVDEELEEAAEVKGVLGAFAMLTPILPPILVTAFKLEVIPVIIFCVFYCALTTCLKKGWTGTMNILGKTWIEGLSKGGPAVILMITIGMLLNAVNSAQVKTALEPFLSAVAPSGIVVFIIFFIVLAPLCLYRGPFNLFGLGAGICSLFVGLNLLTPAQAMVGFVGVSVMQAICCPTNTHNAWVASYTEQDVTGITVKALPFVWPAVAAMIIVGTIMYV